MRIEKATNKTKIVILIFLGLFSFIAVLSQSKSDLEKQKELLQKDISYKNSILKQTKKNQQLSSIQLVVLEKKIISRKNLISNIQAQLRLSTKKLENNRALIESLQEDIQELKADYAKMIYYAFRNRNSYDRLMFIFSSDDFNQAYRRLRYIQLYSAYREEQAKMIQKTQEMLQKKVIELESDRNEKERLLGIERNEKGLLTHEITEQKNTYNSLIKKEEYLKKEIEKNQLKAKKLQKEIEKIIAEELISKGKNFFSLTPESKLLSKSFSSNKGKLPWPVKKGVITEYFGEHSHPVLKQIIVNNNGINISTSKGSSARAVFEGVVSGIVILPGAGKAVMIRHGEYISIYSNLENVDLIKGQHVSTKQVVGKILTDHSTGKTTLHFELWKGQTILNPSPWLYRSR